MFKISIFSNSQIEIDLKNEKKFKIPLFEKSYSQNFDQDNTTERQKQPANEKSLRKLSLAPTVPAPTTAKCTNPVAPLNLLGNTVDVGLQDSSLSQNSVLGCDGIVLDSDST